MRKVVLFLILILFPSTIYAQKLIGRVMDSEEKSPIEAVNVVILDADSVYYTSKISNTDGRFELEVSLDSYYVSISILGYKSYNIFIQRSDDEDMNLKNIMLEKDHKLLGDVVVTASGVSNALNKIVAYPTTAQTAASSTGMELLRNLNLPGLFVDPVGQSVRVSGASQIVYKINGRTVPQHRIVTIAPESVLRIEYGDSPTTRYASSDAATINIILKNERQAHFYLLTF